MIARWIWLVKETLWIFGAKTKGYNAAMRKAIRGHPLSYKDEKRHKRISAKDLL